MMHSILPENVLSKFDNITKRGEVVVSLVISLSKLEKLCRKLKFLIQLT